MAAALASTGALPHCIKPNRHELEDWAGRPLPTDADSFARRVTEGRAELAEAEAIAAVSGAKSASVVKELAVLAKEGLVLHREGRISGYA